MRGDRLRELRELREMSQQDLADMVGMSHTQIFRIEKGTSIPTADTVVKLARVLDCTTDYLLGLANDTTGHVWESELSPIERRLLAAYRRDDLRLILDLLTKPKDSDE